MSRQPEPTGLHYGTDESLAHWQCMADVVRRVAQVLAENAVNGNNRPIVIDADEPEQDNGKAS